jgi:hypothetical protein
MNESTNDKHFIKDIASDEGVQRAAAGVVVAVVVAAAKNMMFTKGA